MSEHKREDIEEAAELQDAAEAAGEEALAGAEGEAQELEALRQERDEYKDRFIRALADAENIRKRGERDRREAERYGGSKLARDLLPVYDNLKRAIEAAREDQSAASQALMEGIELTMKELIRVFEKHGIVMVAPKVGERFDPQLHEAMFEAPVPGTRAGDIIQVNSDGFILHDRLLRPAQVGVSSTPKGAEAQGEAQQQGQ